MSDRTHVIGQVQGFLLQVRHEMRVYNIFTPIYFSHSCSRKCNKISIDSLTRAAYIVNTVSRFACLL